MIDGDMGATQTAAPRREPLRRDPRTGSSRGVCAGIGRHLRHRPADRAHRLRRGGHGRAAWASLLYGLAWVLVPVDDARRAPRAAGRGACRRGRGAIEVAVGLGLAPARPSCSPCARWGSGSPTRSSGRVVLVAAGGALLWRQSLRPDAGRRAARAAAGRARGGAPRAHARSVSRNGVGVALVIAAGLVFL